MLDVGFFPEDGKDEWPEKRQTSPRFNKAHQCARIVMKEPDVRVQTSFGLMLNTTKGTYYL